MLDLAKWWYSTLSIASVKCLVSRLSPLQVYQGKETSDHLLARLQAFKQGSAKEQQVYACMVHNLFDEYRFFPKYPEKERHITALLLGGLVRPYTFKIIGFKISLQ